MSKIFDVNNKDVIKFSNRLEKMHKSDFPLAVRGTLNDLAFDQKTKELMIAAEQVFILRNPNFIRSHTGVIKADGWDVNNMQSICGVTPKGLQAAKQLEVQEKGGTIPDRKIIYVDPARGGSKEKRVKTRNWVNKSGYVQGRPNRRRGRRSQIVAQSVVARNTGKLIKIKTRTSDHFFKVNSVRFIGRGLSRRVNMRMTAIASYERGRSIKISKERPFMRISGERSLSKANNFFIKNAERRFEKALMK